MEQEQRQQTILALKEVMKKIAAISAELSPANQDILRAVSEDIKLVCEIINY